MKSQRINFLGFSLLWIKSNFCSSPLLNCFDVEWDDILDIFEDSTSPSDTFSTVEIVLDDFDDSIFLDTSDINSLNVLDFDNSILSSDHITTVGVLDCSFVELKKSIFYK